MIMSSSATSTPIQHDLYNEDEQPRQILEVRLRFFIRLMEWNGVSNRILRETAAIPLETAVFRLPLHELDDDPVFIQIYIAQLLSLLNISAPASEVIAGQIASYVLQMTEENREMNFHVVAVVDNIQHTWMPPFPVLFPVPTRRLGGSAMVEETVVREEPPAAIERFRMEKLLEGKDEEEEEDSRNQLQKE